MNSLGRCGVVVSSRFGSSRLPGKAIFPIDGKPLLSFLLERIRAAETVTGIFLATTRHHSDDILEFLALEEGVGVYRGSSNDLCDRYLAAASIFSLQTVVRVTADCPYVDASLVDYCLNSLKSGPDFDIATTKGVFPVGLDIEIIRVEALKRLVQSGALSPSEREHLTLGFYSRPGSYSIRKIIKPSYLNVYNEIYTVDNWHDYEMVLKQLPCFREPLIPRAGREVEQGSNRL